MIGLKARIANVLFLSGIACAGILDNFNWARSDRIEVNLPWLPFENETRCYDELGCLNITRTWYHLINRPFNVFPLPRSVINTRFILYTRLNPSEGQVIRANNQSIERSNLDVKKKTKFIIHGFIDTPLSNWPFFASALNRLGTCISLDASLNPYFPKIPIGSIRALDAPGVKTFRGRCEKVQDMKDELIKFQDVNVVVVDWAGGSLPLYTQATANTRLVGMEIANLINYIVKNYEIDPRDIHIIGHSLGAHTAGYAGALVPGLGRITGLDPAEPYFQGMPAHVRLDPTDAELVDVIHTDGKGIFFLGYGMSQPCGHLDFYPNDGKEQPGCDITQTPLVPLTLIRDGLEEASRVLVACNHVRAIKLFIDSISTKCPYIGHQCKSFNQFKEGRCFICKPGSNCAIMGYHADTTPGFLENNEVQPQSSKLQETVGSKYFLTTGKEYPYCHRMYRITTELAHPPFAENWVQGHLRASIYSPSGVLHVELTPSGDMKLEHGATYTTMVSHPIDLGGNVRKVELNWEYDMNVLEPRTLCLFWCNDHLYVKNVLVEEMEMPGRGKRDAQFSSRLCSKGKKDFADIANRGKGVFVDSCATDKFSKS